MRRTRGLALLVVVAAATGIGSPWRTDARAGDDLLIEATPVPGAEKPEAPSAEEAKTEEDAAKAHKKLFTENRFPSATVCRTCHPEQFRQWAESQHAYTQISPVLQAMQGLILKLTNGTNGDFCIRCHNPIGMNLGEPLFTSTMERHPASREGVTCVVCHRMPEPYGKVSGRLYINEGPIFSPIYGPTGHDELQRVIGSPDYSVNTDPDKPGRGVHRDAIKFERITTSAFCGTCHDVTLADNLRLEEAFSEWKNSPAAAKGVTCQDCHMSTDPGRPSGYAFGPAAIVGGVPTRPRMRADHRFAGPDYSVVHPGIFPFNDKAQTLATIAEWITFDYKAGWGTKEFEAHVPADAKFPPRWRSADDRMDARGVIEENQAALADIAGQRLKILQAGYQLGDVEVSAPTAGGVRFRVPVRNGTDGHNAPTGLDNERLVYLHVTVRDANGKVVFESGDLDPNGDVRDQHSTYVHAGELPLDPYLFSLRSKFIVNMGHGGDREQVSPINISVDALPFVRPETRPAILTGRPSRSRKHKRGLPPNGERYADYEVTADQLAQGTPPFHADVKLMAGMIPVNLLTIIQIVGFDYAMSPRAVGDAVSAGYQAVWEKDVPLPVASR
jgi:cytochrome c554/c'-like protein